MKRNFITVLLLFILSASANAQERGDGKAQDADKAKDPNGIISGRPDDGPSGRAHNHRFRNSGFFGRNLDNEYSRGSAREPIAGTTDFGAKVGGNFQQLATSPFTNSYAAGIVGGLYVRRFWGASGIKIELLCNSAHYVSRGPAAVFNASHSTNSDSVTKSEFKALYIDIPLVYQLKLYQKLFLEVGTQYRQLVSSTDKNGAYTQIYKKNDIFRKGEFSGVIGLEYALPYHLKVGVRYIKGFTDVNNNLYPQAYEQWTINSIQATIGYRLY